MRGSSKTNLTPIEMVVKLNKAYAYTLEEISKVIELPRDTTKELIEGALMSGLLAFRDFEQERELTEELVQVKTVRYYRRIF